MFKFLGLNRSEEVQLPVEDALRPTVQLLRGRAVFQAQAGVPSTADALAYEPIQRLLAVSSCLEAHTRRMRTGSKSTCSCSCTWHGNTDPSPTHCRSAPVMAGSRFWAGRVWRACCKAHCLSMQPHASCFSCATKGRWSDWTRCVASACFAT